MSDLLAGLAVVSLAFVLALAGRGLLRLLPGLVLPEDWAFRAVLHLLAGCLALHGVMTALDLAGVPWGRLAIGGTLAALAAVGPLFTRRPALEPPSGLRLGWGDLVATLALAAFTVAVVELWSTNPDFIYHWGVKGHRFYLAEAVDYEFLAKWWNRLAHPDYPFLLPELFVVTALARGFFDELAALLWTPVFLLALFAAGRFILAGAGLSSFGRQGTLAVVAVALAAFGVPHKLSGGPDGMIALALVVGAAAFLVAREVPGRALPERDLWIALAAAFAATSKVEGVVLGAFLLAGWGLDQRLWQRPWPWRRLALLGLPALVVVLPWLWGNLRHDLFGQPNSGPFRLENAELVFPAVGRALVNDHWHGFALLAVVAAPFLLRQRALRWPVGIALLQLVFYLYVYHTNRAAAHVHVASSLPRILVHVVPALLLAAGIALDRWANRPDQEADQKAARSALPQTSP